MSKLTSLRHLLLLARRKYRLRCCLVRELFLPPAPLSRASPLLLGLTPCLSLPNLFRSCIGGVGGSRRIGSWMRYSLSDAMFPLCLISLTIIGRAAAAAHAPTPLLSTGRTGWGAGTRRQNLKDKNFV